MAKSKKYQKHIFCVEGELDRLEKSPSSRHMLKQLFHFSSENIKHIFRHCATKEELEYYLGKIPKKYDIIYFSVHGFERGICLGKDVLDLKELATLSPNAFEGKIVHFGSCETLKASTPEVYNFIAKTKCIAVSGYFKEVSFIEGSALELLYFDLCQDFLYTKSIFNNLKKSFPNLIDRTGFRMLQA